MNLNLKHRAPVNLKVHDMLSELQRHARERGQTFTRTKKYKKGKFAYMYIDKQTGEQISELLTIREAYKLIGEANDRS